MFIFWEIHVHVLTSILSILFYVLMICAILKIFFLRTTVKFFQGWKIYIFQSVVGIFHPSYSILKKCFISLKFSGVSWWTLRLLLLVHFCFVVWVFFSIFSILCIMSFGDQTHPQHQETTETRKKQLRDFSKFSRVCAYPVTRKENNFHK